MSQKSQQRHSASNEITQTSNRKSTDVIKSEVPSTQQLQANKTKPNYKLSGIDHINASDMSRSPRVNPKRTIQNTMLSNHKKNFVQANRSMLTNSNKMSIEQQLDVSKIQQKQHQRLQQRDIYNMASPNSTAVKDAMSSRSRDSKDMKNVYISNPVRQDKANSQFMQIYRDQSNDQEMEASYRNREGIIYGDVSVDQHGKVLDTDRNQNFVNQLQNSMVIPPIVPNLNLEGPNQLRNLSKTYHSNMSKKKTAGKKKRRNNNEHLSYLVGPKSALNEPSYRESDHHSLDHQRQGFFQNSHYSNPLVDLSNPQHIPKSKYTSNIRKIQNEQDGQNYIKIGAVLGNVNIIHSNKESLDSETNQDGPMTYGQPNENNRVLTFGQPKQGGYYSSTVSKSKQKRKYMNPTLVQSYENKGRLNPLGPVNPYNIHQQRSGTVRQEQSMARSSSRSHSQRSKRTFQPSVATSSRAYGRTPNVIKGSGKIASLNSVYQVDRSSTEANQDIIVGNQHKFIQSFAQDNSKNIERVLTGLEHGYGQIEKYHNHFNQINEGPEEFSHEDHYGPDTVHMNHRDLRESHADMNFKGSIPSDYAPSTQNGLENLKNTDSLRNFNAVPSQTDLVAIGSKRFSGQVNWLQESGKRQMLDSLNSTGFNGYTQNVSVFSQQMKRPVKNSLEKAYGVSSAGGQGLPAINNKMSKQSQNKNFSPRQKLRANRIAAGQKVAQNETLISSQAEAQFSDQTGHTNESINRKFLLASAGVDARGLTTAKVSTDQSLQLDQFNRTSLIQADVLQSHLNSVGQDKRTGHNWIDHRAVPELTPRKRPRTKQVSSSVYGQKNKNALRLANGAQKHPFNGKKGSTSSVIEVRNLRTQGAQVQSTRPGVNRGSKRAIAALARESEIVANRDTERVVGAATSNTDVREAGHSTDQNLNSPGPEALSYMNQREISLLNALKVDSKKRGKKGKNQPNPIPRLIHDQALELMNQQFHEHSVEAQQNQLPEQPDKAAASVDLSKDLKQEFTQASRNLDTVDQIGDSGAEIFNQGEADASIGFTIGEPSNLPKQETQEVHKDGQDSEFLHIQEKMTASVASAQRPTGTATAGEYNKSADDQPTYEGITADEQQRNRTQGEWNSSVAYPKTVGSAEDPNESAIQSAVHEISQTGEPVSRGTARQNYLNMNIKDLLDAEDQVPTNFNQEMIILSDRDQGKVSKRTHPSKRPTFAIEDSPLKKGKRPKGGASVTNETERLRRIVKDKAQRLSTTRKINQGAKGPRTADKPKALGSKRESIKQVENLKDRYEYKESVQLEMNANDSSELRKLRDSSRGRAVKTASAAPAESSRIAKKEETMNTRKKQIPPLVQTTEVSSNGSPGKATHPVEHSDSILETEPNNVNISKKLKSKEINKASQDKLSKLSRLTDRQNALGPKIALKQGRSQSELGQSQIKSHGKASSTGYQPAQEDSQYGDIINIKLPSKKQKRQSPRGKQGSTISKTTKGVVPTPRRSEKIDQLAEKSVLEGKSKRDKNPKKQDKQQAPKRQAAISSRRTTDRPSRRDSADKKAQETVDKLRKQYETNNLNNLDPSKAKQALPMHKPGEISYKRSKSPPIKSRYLQPREQVQSQQAPLIKKEEKGKHVQFPAQVDEKNQDQSGVYNFNLPQSKVAKEYEKILGKQTKFVAENSPIDRYYKMYVVEPESKVFQLSSARGGGTTRMRHLKGCPNGISRASLSPAATARREKLRLPSHERQEKAIAAIQREKSPEGVMNLAYSNQDVQSVLQHQTGECNCHVAMRDWMQQRLTKSPSQTRSMGLGDGLYPGDNVSYDGLEDGASNFRTFRSPCRKLCSTIHNPMYHVARFNLQIRPIRPASAQMSRGQKAQMLLEIDWLETGLNAAVREEEKREFDVEQKRRANADLGGGYHTSAERDHSPNDLGMKLNYGTDEEQVDSPTGAETGQVAARRPNHQAPVQKSGPQVSDFNQSHEPQAVGSLGSGPQATGNIGSGTQATGPSPQPRAPMALGGFGGKGGWNKLRMKQNVISTWIQKDKEDMRNVLKNLNKQEEEAKRYGILTDKEVQHNYSIVKEASLESQMSNKEKQDLNKICWRTLEHVMNSLMLKKDFALLLDSHKRKIEQRERNMNKDTPKEILDKQEHDDLLKILVRCSKMYEAKQEVVRILAKVKKRENLIKQFESEVDEASETRAKGYYYILLKISTKLHNQVERLKVDNPMLHRPFIYQRKNLQTVLVRDQVNIRENLIRRFRGLKDELDRVLDKSGKIIRIETLIELNKLEKLEKQREQQDKENQEESRSQSGSVSNREKTPDSGARRSGAPASHLRKLARASQVSSMHERQDMTRSAKSFRTANNVLSEGAHTPDRVRMRQAERDLSQ